ncbi:class I SAM-dependent methyltransferase [Granulicella sp. S190]|uniref:class I SAM-dependent methyltransferase n=1 Tax=Granulicella sp. S190 TaxID=1747226 RepID=UPI00131CBBE8|nr:class I SAM-dependent methyltransferase [Granulicella sp. S190]
MTRLSTAWSKLRWSLAQRGVAGTVRTALGRVQRHEDATASGKPLLHPFDKRYGVDTSGLIGGGELRSGHKNDVFNTAYYGMAPSRFRRVVEDWISSSGHAPLSETSFIDLGCGKGRAVLMASEFVFRQAIGVELNPSLTKTAESNLALWTAAGRAVCPVTVLCQDATEFAFPDGPCLLYLFNPFAAPVVKRLIERLETEFANRPGSLDVIYFNPESGELFESHPGFKLLWSGTVELSDEDAAADHVASPDDLCSIFRWVGL